MNLISKDLSKAISLLNNDALIAIPTETVYGLAGNIYSKKAIKAIFEIKKRPFFNPLIVHIPTIHDISKIVEYVPKKAQLLAEAFWPGSITLVLKKKSTIPDMITAGKNTVAVRVPNHPLTLDLLNQLDFPLAAPSANPFGSISSTKPHHVKSYFKEQIQMILDGGTCKSGIESTIIGFDNNDPIIYRLGSTPVEAIEAVVGEIKIKNKKENTPDAPGMLERHYAPKTTTVLTGNVLESVTKYSNKRIGVLVFYLEIDYDCITSQIVLSKTRDLKEAASNLYAALHQLDKENLDIIIAEKFPDLGLGRSINDRLQRATK